ncbi:SurA N-terminal domain-containing protein [Bacteroidota bacterium]
MATLQRIRNRAGLLVAVIIGMAIFAFVLQDLLSGGKTALSRSQFEFAEINGYSVQYDEYSARVEKLAEYYRLRIGQTSLDEQTMESIREQTWQDMVREYVTQDEYLELGISVSTDELMDMVQGRNPHPIISSLFSDPQTGILNRTFLVQFLRTMNEDPSGAQKTIWLYLENEILKDRAFSKYNNLIRKGLYVTDLEAGDNLRESEKRTDISYVVRRFSSIPDSAISYTESDIQKYYKNHDKDYQQEASRDIEYLLFEVNASEEDDRIANEWINRMKDEYETVEDPVSLVGMESDMPFDDINYSDGSLPESINDFMFSSEVGAVYGPYMEESSYRIARLVDINYLPDSVHARHILLQPDANSNPNNLKALSDSLQRELNQGADWNILAREFSTDGSASVGGDLGWFSEGSMVKPFSDSCFYDKRGDVMMVQTQFGIHLVQVIEKSRASKKVKVAYLSRNIEPSSETYRGIYSQAVKFAGSSTTYEKFNETVASQNLTKRYASDLTESQRTITGLENPRPLIRWAFEAELHDVTREIFEFSDKYVVAVVSGIREKGVAPLEQVKAEVELEVKKEKKAQKISQDFETALASHDDIESLGLESGLSVEQANNINFTSVSLPGAGIEPRVIAAASVLPEGQMSQPVHGNNGVYVIVVTRVAEPETTDLSFTRTRMTAMRESQANFEAYDALMDDAKIKDNRSKFF